jgi:hypothetical protein
VPNAELARTMAMASGIQITKTTVRLWRTQKRAREDSMGVQFKKVFFNLQNRTL